MEWICASAILPKEKEHESGGRVPIITSVVLNDGRVIHDVPFAYGKWTIYNLWRDLSTGMRTYTDITSDVKYWMEIKPPKTYR